MTLKARLAISAISDEEWRKIILKLNAYAARIATCFHWRTPNYFELPGGETSESIVSKVIEKLLVGDINWDPERVPDILVFLYVQVWGQMSHLAEKAENVIVEGAPESGSKDSSAWESGSGDHDARADWTVRASGAFDAAAPEDRIAVDRSTPLDILIRKEQKDFNDEVLRNLRQKCSDDAVLTRILQVLEQLSGTESNMRKKSFFPASEISRLTGIGIQEVYEAGRRLARKVELVRQELARGGGAAARKERAYEKGEG